MNGWRGMLATTERFQIALEGSMMALGMVCLNVWHPERLLKDAGAMAEEHARDIGTVGMETEGRQAREKGGG